MIPAGGRAALGISLLDKWDNLGRPLGRLPRWAAASVLAMLAAVMAWSVILTAPVDQIERQRVTAPVKTPGKDKGDLALYARISARMAAGEGYYAAAMDEQRASNYPTRPFVAVRQPTLAWLHQLIGVGGVQVFELGLVVACLWALNTAVASLVSLPERLAALVLMVLGGAAASVSTAGLIHELWAGLWLTLALLLYRPERWWPSLIAVSCALAVRELSVPFVMLWLVFALAARRWHEVAGIAALLAVFAAGMGLHYLAVEAGRLPGDPVSEGWDAMIGFGLPLMGLARLTGLALLPVQLAAPLALLPMIGWAAIGGRLGLFALLWFGGLFTMIALFARPENYYWVQLALPAYGLGLAFAPRGVVELFRGAAGNVARQT